MSNIYAFEGVVPVVHPSAYVHPTAVLIGDVIVGPRCYVGPCASLRGDFGRLVMEDGSNLQDCCVVHGYPGTVTVIEADGHIGHGAVLHGCRIRRGAMVGMNAVVMDGAEIGEDSIVGALAFVKTTMVIPPRSLVVGVPARVLRQVTEQELAAKAAGTAEYQELARRCLATMKRVEPLTEIEPGRKRL